MDSNCVFWCFAAIYEERQEAFEKGAEIIKEEWQRLESNQRPRAYESPALPLSYAATLKNIARSIYEVNLDPEKAELCQNQIQGKVAFWGAFHYNRDSATYQSPQMEDKGS